jgi:hypothetical protein
VPIYPNSLCGAAAIPLSTDAFATPIMGLIGLPGPSHVHLHRRPRTLKEMV